MALEGGRSNLNNGNAARKVTALVVDDDFICREVMALILKRHGFDTCKVESANEAIDLFRDGKEFDAVFMDVHMPGKKGTQVCSIKWIDIIKTGTSHTHKYAKI